MTLPAERCNAKQRARERKNKNLNLIDKTCCSPLICAFALEDPIGSSTIVDIN